MLWMQPSPATGFNLSENDLKIWSVNSTAIASYERSQRERDPRLCEFHMVGEVMI